MTRPVLTPIEGTGIIATAALQDGAVTLTKVDPASRSVFNLPNTLVQRFSDGRFEGATPLGDNDVATAGWVLGASVLTSPWTAVTLVNGWTTAPASNALRYKKLGNVVFLQGSVSGGSKTNNVMGTLPVGFRPGAWARCIGEATPSGTNEFVTVATNGEISCPGTLVITCVLVYPAEG